MLSGCKDVHENNVGIEHSMEKYSNESYRLSSGQHFPLEYFCCRIGKGYMVVSGLCCEKWVSPSNAEAHYFFQSTRMERFSKTI